MNNANVDELLNELEPFEELTNDIDEWHDAKELAKQKLLALLESKAEDYNVIDEGGYEASRDPISAVPMSAIRELFNANERLS